MLENVRGGPWKLCLGMRAELWTKTFFSLALQVTHRINEIEQVLLVLGLNRTGTTNKLLWNKEEYWFYYEKNARKCVLCYR